MMLRPVLRASTLLSRGPARARAFHPSPFLLKKRSHPAPNDAPATGADPENPLDLSTLTGSYALADAHFKTELQSLLRGGRFNADSLGAIPIPLKSTGQTFSLREVAQVVPRPGARTVSLLVNDRKHVKDVMAAIQRSADFNQQPQRAEDNELELLLRVEPDRKDDLARRVRDACQAWRERVRQARTKHEKTLKDWRRTGAVVPDVVRRAEKEVQKVQDKKMKEIDQEEAQTIKQLDRR